MIRSTVLILGTFAFAYTVAPARAKETVYLDLNLSGVPGWTSMPEAENTAARTKLEQDLLVYFREWLPAWDFQADSAKTPRVVVGFKAIGDADPEKAGLQAQLQLLAPPDARRTQKLFRNTPYLDLWPAGAPEWTRAIRNGPAEMVGVIWTHLEGMLDFRLEALRDRFCNGVPVTGRAGYFPKLSVWIAFFEPDYLRSDYRIRWTEMGVPEQIFEGKGTATAHQAPMVVAKCLLIQGKSDVPTLNKALSRLVYLLSLDPTMGAEQGPN